MSLPCDYNDPRLLDEFEVLLDDFQLDFLEPYDSGVCELSSVKMEAIKCNEAQSKPPKGARKSSSAKSVTKVTSDLILRKQNQAMIRLTRHAFPSFDRSDSTIYFASSFARLCNNGDEKGLNKLISNHCAKDTEVVLREGTGENRDGRFCVTLAYFLDILAINNAINPDTMSCMHSTKVDGNKIVAVLYSKQTDSAEMYDYRGTVIEPKYQWMYCGRRKDLLIRNMDLNHLEASKRTPVLKLLDENVDVEMYNRVEITLILHERTKKVVDFRYYSTTTSLFYDGVHYPTV